MSGKPVRLLTQNTGRQFGSGSPQRGAYPGVLDWVSPLTVQEPYRSVIRMVLEVPSGNEAGIREEPSHRATTVDAHGVAKDVVVHHVVGVGQVLGPLVGDGTPAEPGGLPEGWDSEGHRKVLITYASG